MRKFATKFASRQNSVNQYFFSSTGVFFLFRWRTWYFGWRIFLVKMVYLVFWLAYSFHSDGVLIVLVGVFFSYRWHTWYFGWRNILIKMVYLVFWLAYSFHSDGVLAILVGVVFWLKLCVLPGKKYAGLKKVRQRRNRRNWLLSGMMTRPDLTNVWSKTLFIDMNILNSQTDIRPNKVAIPDTRNTRWFWRKNRVRIGYCQKLSGRVGYRVPVRHCSQGWSSLLNKTQSKARITDKKHSRAAQLPRLKACL